MLIKVSRTGSPRRTASPFTAILDIWHDTGEPSQEGKQSVEAGEAVVLAGLRVLERRSPHEFTTTSDLP